MPHEIHILWVAVASGALLTCILLSMMYTHRRLALVRQVAEEARRLVASDRTTVVERQIQLMFDLIERRLASSLHAPHLPEMDALLQKVKNQTITPEEAVALYVMLIERRTELVIEGVSRPDLDFPELFVLWSLEVRIARAGLTIPTPSLSSTARTPPSAVRLEEGERDAHPRPAS